MLGLENINPQTIWSNLIGAMIRPFSNPGQPDDMEAPAKVSPKLVRVVDPETGEDFVYPDAGEEKNLRCYRPTPVDILKLSRKRRAEYKRRTGLYVIDGEEVKVEDHHINADYKIFLVNGNAVAVDWRKPSDEVFDLKEVFYVAPIYSEISGHEKEEVKDLNDHKYYGKGVLSYSLYGLRSPGLPSSTLKLSKRDEEALARHFCAENLKRIAYPEMCHPQSTPQQSKPPDGPGFH